MQCREIKIMREFYFFAVVNILLKFLPLTSGASRAPGARNTTVAYCLRYHFRKFFELYTEIDVIKLTLLKR